MKRALVGACLLGVACSSPEPRARVPYRNDFATSLGPEWTRNQRWQVVDGRLMNDGAHNVPFWLDAALPADVRVSFTVESKSPEVDVKFEVFGDGEHHESGYSVVLAGWKNTLSIIARLGEHAPDRTSGDEERLRGEVRRDAAAAQRQHAKRRDRVTRRVSLEPSRSYRVRFERQGHELRLFLDEELHLSYFDPAPLSGAGHDRFAFANWASLVFFDDLVIDPL